MTTYELEMYLHRHIPMSEKMRVSVVGIEADSVVLSAPLEPNINHRDTVFGGSAAAVAVLAAWSLVHTRLLQSGLGSRLVIQRNTMSFARPITGSFTARSSLSSPAAWQPFIRTLQRKGRARIRASCDLHFAGQTAGHFEGEFVAFGPEVDALQNK